jgi:hypothetical protein
LSDHRVVTAENTYPGVVMNSPEVKAFIRENRNLFWYTPEDMKEDISPEFLVETILNYGDLENIRKLIRILGLKETTEIFFSARGRKKMNYYPEIYNFFSLLFSRYAQGDTVG